MTQFGRINTYLDNTEAASPGVTNDASQGYSVGSRWYDARYNIAWYCTDNTTGAAKWVPMTSGVTLGSLIGANMNVTTDQVFKMNFDLSGTLPLRYSVAKILVTNASISLTTAAGGIYDTAAKAGNAIVAAAQAYSTLTTTAKVLGLTIATAGSTNAFSIAPILSLTTAQGAAATADFYLTGDIFYAA